MSSSEFWYQPHEGHGVTATIVAACISFISVVTLLSLLTWVSISGQGPANRPFLKTHIGAYFLSLMAADLSQTVGGIMSARWVMRQHISVGRFCTAQAAIKQFSNVGTAVWSAIIAIHTFRILFFNSKTSNALCYTTLAVTWSVVITVVVVGPTVVESSHKGAYFGISGYWCWITNGYVVEKFCLEYCFMFASAFISLVLYTMIFFRLRGNLIAEGYRIRVISVTSSRAWNLEAGRAVMESNTMSIAWQLMWYPVAYTITILPIACSRWAQFTGSKVPFEVTIFSSVVFLLSGFCNVLLFVGTRRVLPPIKLRRKSMSSSIPGISINVHATRTQQVSFANGEPSYIITLPPPELQHIESPEYELETRIQATPLPGKERRISRESTEPSFTGMGKSEHDKT